MNYTNSLFKSIVLGSLCFLFACSPRVLENSQESSENTDALIPDTIQVISDCPGFKDSRRIEQLISDYQIYKDFMSLEKYTQSFDYWKKVYRRAPAGYGNSPEIYIDGILYYTHFYEATSDVEEKEDYAEKIFELYREAIECFPTLEGSLKAQMAAEYYYNYPGRKSDKELSVLFISALNKLKGEVPIFTIIPTLTLLQKGYEKEFVEADTLKKYTGKIHQSLKTADQKNPQWKQVIERARAIFKQLEAEKGLLSCMYYKDVYLPVYEVHKKNCDTVEFVYNKLKKWAGCTPDDKLKEMKAILDGACTEEAVSEVEEPQEQGNAGEKALEALKQGRYKDAIKKFKGYFKTVDNPDKKGDIALLIAKIYYIHLSDFPDARTWALKASEYKHNWGDPYILIGKLYASSGELCGGGSGWDAQVVVWPAIDKWKKAIELDPSVQAEAQALIDKYRQYMPSVAEIFARTSIDVGDLYKVECWIQEKTRVRAAPQK